MCVFFVNQHSVIQGTSCVVHIELRGLIHHTLSLVLVDSQCILQLIELLICLVLFVVLTSESIVNWISLIHEVCDCLWSVQSVLRLVNARRNSWRRDNSQRQITVDNYFIMVTSQLQETVDVGKFVLVNNRMFAEVDVIHSLSQIDKRPTLETNVLRRLKLIVQCQETLK